MASACVTRKGLTQSREEAKAGSAALEARHQIGGGVRLLSSQDAHHAGEASESKADGHVVNQSKTDFLTAGINGQQRPQKPAFSFQMNDGSRHSEVTKALSLPKGLPA
jgi:hypothetical protein